MRPDVHPRLTSGRVRTGPYASDESYGITGMFHVKADSGRDLKIIASDGKDWEACGLPLPAWEHVSVSVRDARRSVPTWGEMCWVKHLFWEGEEVVLQFHPAASEYVNHHPGCLHLFKPVGVEIPTPPSLTVGPKSSSTCKRCGASMPAAVYAKHWRYCDGSIHV